MKERASSCILIYNNLGVNIYICVNVIEYASNLQQTLVRQQKLHAAFMAYSHLPTHSIFTGRSWFKSNRVKEDRLGLLNRNLAVLGRTLVILDIDFPKLRFWGMYTLQCKYTHFTKSFLPVFVFSNGYEIYFGYCM